MRSFVDVHFRVLATGLAVAALTGCGMIGGGDRPTSLTAAASGDSKGIGPAADYPMVLGDPFTIDDQLYTPADTLNYDAVGYAAADDGAGVTAAHRTLPLPSYAEVTSLDTGKTILVRIERRGPMTGKSLVALAPAALAQLGASEGAPVRLRRVNPTEAHRAELRAGRSAPERIETPKGLVEVLRRKLPPSGAANVRTAVAPIPGASSSKAPGDARAKLPPVGERTAARPAPPAGVVAAYPLPPLAGKAPLTTPAAAPVRPAPVTYRLPPSQPAVQPAAQVAVPVVRAPEAPAGTFVVQAGAFASEANAKRAAQALGGFVSPAGKFYRVRTGPFANRGQAEAALAKVRAAGYSDARVTTQG